MAEQEKDQGNIKQEYNLGTTGLNLDQTVNQIKKGTLTYALNAAVENFDASSVNYQNEPGNELCITYPEGYHLIGTHFISEQNKHIFFMTNPTTGGSQIGFMDNNDCIYQVLINAPCLNFSIQHPIHKIVHKLNNCSTEIYWTDGVNPRRYLDINDIPRILRSGSPMCSAIYTDDVDCNQLKLQPNFSIPELEVVNVVSGGNLISGTYQFAIQYSDASSNAYTSYYSVTNPTPISDPQFTTVNFNYPVGKSIVVNVTNLDVTGQFQYFNLVVIKTINAISSVELLGTYFIDSTTKEITYTGQNVAKIKLIIDDVFEKFPYYDIAQDLTAVQDVLVWDNLSSIDRINYQHIANKITLGWETYRIPASENYSDELNATNLRSYLRDEVYPFEIVFLLKNGKQTDRFHIPGRAKQFSETSRDDVPDTNNDFIGEPEYTTLGVGYSPYWRIYNTGSVTGVSTEYSSAANYKGPYKHGDFAYWESTEEYPCNVDVWGELAGQKIRHHKFPDVLVSPITESLLFTGSSTMVMENNAIFPIGVKIDPSQITYLIGASSLTQEQKSEIVGYKIVRGDRGTNKSIVAKGILRNVGTYTREKDRTIYFPNYPYNDLTKDPFINGSSSSFIGSCTTYDIFITTAPAKVEYTDCGLNKIIIEDYAITGTSQLCSLTKPTITLGAGYSSTASYEIWRVWVETNFAPCRGWTVGWEDITDGYKTMWLDGSTLSNFGESATIQVVIGSGGPRFISGPGKEHSEKLGEFISPNSCTTVAEPLQPIKDDIDLSYRQIFNSPETSFGQPFLGNILKLESVMFGAGKAHFVEVKENAKYKFISKEAQQDALQASQALAMASDVFDATAMFSAYDAYLTIYINGLTRKNYAYSFNSIASYDYNVSVPNNLGIKQRNLDIKKYLIPGVVSTGDKFDLNNWNRETSVYLRTVGSEDNSIAPLPFPDKSTNMAPGGISLAIDKSRFTASEKQLCDNPRQESPISVVSYYASLKNMIVNQWGQIYSYPSVDTGYQQIIGTANKTTIFGGDTFIGKFAFKTKLPFFIDNRVNAPDDSDVFYDEISNIGYPKYWHSSRSILKNYTVGSGILYNIISYKAHNFDCPNSQYIVGTDPSANPNRTFYDGKFYLFAYGVPNFYCESAYNVDLRQAFNNREGDFFPHVSSSIPDDWVQESFVPIAQDNSYYYNITYSKQNKENVFTYLPPDWENKLCFTNYPFRAIYSDNQNTDSDNKVNSWLSYKAVSYFDFPQNYGKLISLDGIQNKAVLARFENKTLMYNNLLTIDTSNPQAAYLGNPVMFKGAPPIDFAETDLGYVGSQNKMLLKLPQGQLTADAKRGQVFVLAGTEATDLSAFGSGLNRFFTDHLAFEILRYFPNANTDNHLNGMGLHAVYDSKFDRILLTKLDYIPKDKNIKYDAETGEFYIEEVITVVTNDCNLEGIAEIVDTCVLAGTASEITPILTPINYGNLYNWFVVNDVREIAPIGFHIPNDIEYEALATYLGGRAISGKELKEVGTTHWFTGNTGTNTTNFNGVGGGYRFAFGGGSIFSSLLYRGVYWTKYVDTTVRTNQLSYDTDILEQTSYLLSNYGKQLGASLRFVADSGTPTTAIGNDGKVYPCVTIGSQTWTAKNSSETKYRTGELIPTVTNSVTWASLTTDAMCYYDNDPLNA